MVQQYNMDVQQSLPAKLILEVGYVGTRGTRLAESRIEPRTAGQPGQPNQWGDDEFGRLG